MKYVGLEKRKFIRLDANYIVSYRIKVDSEGYDLTQTKNVSQGGAIIATDKRYKKNDILELVVRFPFVTQRVKVIAEVVSCREKSKDALYEVRLKFLNLDEKYYKKIGEHINSRREK